MARSFNDTQEEYLEISAGIVTAHPMVYSCWFYTDDLGSTQFVMIQHDGVGLAAILLEFIASGDTLRATSTDGGTTEFADTSTSVSANQWNHGIAIFASATDRRVLLNGGGRGTDSGSKSPSGIAVTSIGGAELSGTVYFAMSGMIAESAIWDLSDWPGATDSDKADNFESIAVPSLALGYAPSFYPLGLKAYWQLIRDEDQDRVGGYDMTPFNTPSIAPHPPMIYPTSMMIPTIGIIAAGETVIVDTLTLAGTAETITVVPGAISTIVDALTLAGTAETITVVPGTTSVTINALTLTGTAETITVAPGAISTIVNALVLTSVARTITAISEAEMIELRLRLMKSRQIFPIRESRL